MSGLAVMHLKYPSLLQFDRDCVKKPDKKEVLPLMPEPITSHPSLYESVDELDKADQVVRYQYTDEEGYRHWFRFVNDVPVNKSHKETLVNYLEYVEIDPKGNKKYVNTWITDIKLTRENVAKVMRGGRARWKIENETFNTLKTQGYHLEHNYGHGEQHLATNLACLTFTAFLINQIEQLACKFFQQALEAKKSKKALWLGIRGLFDWFVIDNWEDVYTAIIGGRSVSLKHLVVDTT
ncbi:hypothetical protein [Endozoicomonas sp. ALB091]|uniref:hypothetical protein n=1 Tax=Endozoicomonas sp. ALB091 TaxID=3403073 RepID=UPI003BB5C4BD